MDREPSRSREESGLLVGRGRAGTSRYLARERQKSELRHERDHLVLSLARELGTDGLAERLGTTPAVTATMLARARERLAGEEAAEDQPAITARRLPPDSDRWIDADHLYETLGRTRPLPARTPPPSDP